MKITEYKEFLKNQNEKLDYFLDNCESYNNILNNSSYSCYSDKLEDNLMFEKKLKQFLEKRDEELIELLERNPINCTCRGNEPVFELTTEQSNFHCCNVCKKIMI